MISTIIIGLVILQAEAEHGIICTHSLHWHATVMIVVRFVGFSCDWECSPIKSCGVIYSDLVIAKEARQNQDTQLLNKVIR